MYLPVYESDLSDLERDLVSQCFDNNFISSQGDFVREFEQVFANEHECRFGIAMANCSVAIHAVLLALKVGPGDEVICPSLTFIAPANMVRLCGATPVLCDVLEEDLCIDPESLRRNISSRTKAIIVVHAFGRMANMVGIKAVADEFNIPIIEDNAESPFASRDGLLSGSVGLASTFSFFGNKVFTTGEGGMVLTNDDELAEQISIIRDHGMSKTERYVHLTVGTNYRMTNMQAAVGCGQMRRQKEILEARVNIDERYREAFSNSGLPLEYRDVVRWSGTPWLSTVVFNSRQTRDAVRDFLASGDIDSRPMVFPVNHAPCYDGYFVDNFPVATDMSYRSLHLPSGNRLKVSQIVRVVSEIERFFCG